MRRWLKVAVPLGLAVVLSLLVIGFGSTSIDAARGGNGNGNGNGNGHGGKVLQATLTVEPSNPYSAWGQEYTVNGSDFDPNQWVNIVVSGPGCCLGFNQWADGSGSLSFTRVTGDPGTYTIDAYQWNGRKYVLKASVSFSVVEP